MKGSLVKYCIDTAKSSYIEFEGLFSQLIIKVIAESRFAF